VGGSGVFDAGVASGYGQTHLVQDEGDAAEDRA
jgi:hypothetical protein